MALPSDDGALDPCAAANARSAPDHRVADERSFLHATVFAQHRVLNDDSGFYHASAVQDREAVDLYLAFVPVIRLAEFQRVAGKSHSAGNQAKMRLQIFLRTSDVLPVAAGQVCIKAGSVLEQLWENISLKAARIMIRDALEYRRLEYVNSGVDSIPDDLVFGRFFGEPKNAPVGSCLDQSVSGRVHNPGHDNGGVSASVSMVLDYAAQVRVGQHVSVEHNGRVVD